MSVPISQQKQLIKKYFDLLVDQFITDPRHNKNISLVFKDYLKNPKENSTTLGHTQQTTSGGGSRIEWQETPDGNKVPGSEKIIYFPIKYKYIITFLSNYENMDDLRGTVVHEFTHLYLFSTIGKHKHDNRFYSAMQWLESWLDKNQGLNPRVDKSHDRDQYEDSHSEDANDEENTCLECSYPNPYHSPKCSHYQNSPRPNQQPRPGGKPDIANNSQQAAEFDRLKESLENSQDLLALESTYQNVKDNPLYKGKNCDDNRKTLDTLYQQKKYFFQFLNNYQRSITDNSNQNGFGGREYLLIALAIVGIILLVMIGYLALSSEERKK